MMYKVTTLAIALTMAGLVTAHADSAAGNACAASLDADGKTIYAAIVAAQPTMDNLRSVVEEQARSLVLSGKVARGNARANARAAGECVRAGLQ